MKTRNIISWLLFSFTILFFQCTKDDSEASYECIEHEQLTNGFGQQIFLTHYPTHEMPYFNPNNSDEIIYRYGDGITPEFDLIKYNLKTKEKETIYKGTFSRRPRWGKNNWILLNILDTLGYNIYKIKSTGEDLIALTNGTDCFDPEWDISSEKFIYELGFTSPTKYVLTDENSMSKDTLFCGGNSGSSWQHSIYIASSNFRGFSFYNPLECDDSYFYELENIAQSLNGAEWLDEERVFWCHTTGIFITNIVTKETEVIRETCNAHCYQRPTYAPDINKIIVEKLERIKDTEISGRVMLSLVMMNPDGTEEEVIEISE